jgi:hypothetical protein
MSAKEHILSSIRSRHGTVDSFTQLLKLRFLLRPLRYDGDLRALTERAHDVFDFAPLQSKLTAMADAAAGSALACVCAGSGEVRRCAAPGLGGQAAPGCLARRNASDARGVLKVDGTRRPRSLAQEGLRKGIPLRSAARSVGGALLCRLLAKHHPGGKPVVH